jgi:hypothetical protein
MVVERVRPGDVCRLTGLCEEGPLAFSIPDLELRTRLTFDPEVVERRLEIDQVGVEVDQRRVFITYRYPFRYVLYPLQRRLAELLQPASG